MFLSPMSDTRPMLENLRAEGLRQWSEYWPVWTRVMTIEPVKEPLNKSTLERVSVGEAASRTLRHSAVATATVTRVAPHICGFSD